MICIAKENVTVLNTDPPTQRVVIIADVTPAVLPTDGRDVDDMGDNVKIAPGSVLVCLDNSTKYVANESGEFVQWNG